MKKSSLFLCFYVLSLALNAGSGPSFQFTTDPENPSVGDLVTFTVTTAPLPGVQFNTDNFGNAKAALGTVDAGPDCFFDTGTALYPAANTDPTSKADYIKDLLSNTSCSPFSSSLVPAADSTVNWPAKYTFTYNAPGTYDVYFDCGKCPPTLKQDVTKSMPLPPGSKIGTITIGSNVPTLSEWALIVLALFLLVIAIIALKQKNMTYTNPRL